MTGFEYFVAHYNTLFSYLVIYLNLKMLVLEEDISGLSLVHGCQNPIGSWPVLIMSYLTNDGHLSALSHISL